MKKPKGYIALTSMLIILAATLAIAVSINVLSIDTGRTSLTLDDATAAFSLADGCLEEGILRLKRDTGYTGGNLNTANGSCTITIAINGTQRIITSEAAVDMVTRQVSAQVDFATGFTIDYWEEQ